MQTIVATGGNVKFYTGMGVMPLSFLTGALTLPAAHAQELSVQIINEATIVDIPFVLDDIGASQAGAILWVKGEKAPSPLLASFTIKPVQVARLDGTTDGPILWRAFPGNTNSRANTLNLATGPRYFCGAPTNRTGISCLIDKDANGTFDQVAAAHTERGTKPYHVTFLMGAQPLAKPLAYHALADDLRPSVKIELNNCGRDYDRPRFVALSAADRNIPAATRMGWQAKDSSFASCRRGNQIAPVPGSTTVAPSGGYIGQIGPMAFTVGPKQNPQLALVGPVDAQALYRLEGASLVDISIGNTPDQTTLLGMKKYPYPTLMADAGTVIHEGPVPVGGKVATVPFHHAYRGRLTQAITISTLFGKRSLPASTVVYGFPAKSSITRISRGIPDMDVLDDDDYRTVNRELTWCAPLQASGAEKQKPAEMGRGNWSAACIPYSALGNHTIITNLQPAFSVTGVSYNAATSSNDGPPPIHREDTASFEQALRLEYIYEGREGEFINLSEQVYFGSQLTSSKAVKLYATSGNIVAEVAGAKLELTVGTGGDLSVRQLGSPTIGANAVLQWDQRAALAQQLSKLGLKLVDKSDTQDDVK